MREILFQYEQVAPSTWVYLSSLLTIALFFKFNRVWSVRNLDLILLILLSPGLLLVYVGRDREREALDEYRSTVIASQGDAENQLDRILNQAESGPRDRSKPIDGAESVLDDMPPSLAKRFEDGRDIERAGFVWLLAVGALWLIRMLADSIMVRRPLLEPNLMPGGMVFLIVFFYIFLMANVIISQPSAEDLRGPIEAARLMGGDQSRRDGLERNGPGYAVLFMLPTLPTARLDPKPEKRVEDEADHLLLAWRIKSDALPKPWLSKTPLTESDDSPEFVEIEARYAGVAGGRVKLTAENGETATIPLSSLDDHGRQYVQFFQLCTRIAKNVAVLAHLTVILSLIAVGYWHFHNVKMGIGAALLYLMLPYTSQMTGRVDHVLPAALLVLAVVFYRKPLVAGLLIGLATGVIYYPLFLLPLWISFYWQRGLGRFLAGCLSVVSVLVLVLFFVSQDLTHFWLNTQRMLGLMPPRSQGLQGVWGLGWPPVYRFSVLAAFVAMSGSFAIWPAQKNLGTLLCCTTAVMVATQFWHGFGGGLYVAWYLPTLLLTVFRPNLEDRVAIAVLRPPRQAQHSTPEPLVGVA